MSRLLIIIALLLITGCEKTVFGVPEDQWSHLTPQQQSQVIDAYNQRQQTKEQNEPIMAAIGATTTILQTKNLNQ